MHINHVCNLLNKNYYLLQSLKSVKSLNTLRNVYFANFQSHLRYGILFWGSDPKSKEVFKIQKKAVRLICSVNRRSSRRELFKLLNILPVPCVYIMETVCYIKSNNKGLKQNSAIHYYKTSHRLDFQTQFCRTNMLKKSVNNLGTKLYNRLPNYKKFRGFKTL